MKKFLEKTAEYLFTTWQEDVQDLCIVLPNRRGGLFLKRFLSRATGKNLWSPAVFSVEDFLLEISGLRLIDTTEQLFELYEVHREIEKEKAQTFEEFLSWGSQLLHDFTEIDSYLVDAKALFSYLTEAKAIALWNPDGKPLTDFEKNYLRFYNSLYEYYSLYTKKLLSRRTAYPGLMFREVAENIEKSESMLPWKKIIIAGMNAMTKSEERIFDVLVKSGKAEFLWDADRYYVKQDHQEAGDFLRKWLDKWSKPEFRWMEDHFSSGKKSISITGVPDNVGQVKLCGQILSGMMKNNIPAGEIAVILPDEQLLIPLLNSLPPETGELNVTMGLPLRNTPLYTLLDLVFQLHLNVPRFQRPGNPAGYLFYFRDILKILQHPYIVRLAGELMQGNFFALDDLVRSIRHNSRIFYDEDEIFNTQTGLFTNNFDFLRNIFLPWKSLEDIHVCLKKLIEDLREGLMILVKDDKEQARSGNPVDLEYLYSFSLIIQQMESLTFRFHSFSDTNTYYKMFLQISQSTTLPFYGEPLKGIQVMGMLETRTLDFENIILLSVNEGILPAGKTNNSFIPMDIRSSFGLPTYLHNNTIYAYHFYRLLQRASNIHLLYNSVGDDFGGGEKSRLISQLMHEFPLVNKEIVIEHTVLSTPPPATESSRIFEVKKEGDVRVRMEERAVRGLSPTSLNLYRQCPMKFYFHEIAGIAKPEDIQDTIDARVMGQVVHEVFKNIYVPLKDKLLTVESLKSRSGEIETLTAEAFKNMAKGVDTSFGRNHLLAKVTKFLVRSYLKSEIERIESGEEIKVGFLEETFFRFMKIPFHDGQIEIRLKGTVDRIDSYPDTWRILDYKTGKVETKELAVKAWEDLENNTDLDKSFQLLFYAYLFYAKIYDTGTVMESGIIGLKNLKEGVKLVTIPGPEKRNTSLDNAAMKEFGKLLEEMLTEIFDVSKPFTQVADPGICGKCDYINLCSR